MFGFNMTPMMSMRMGRGIPSNKTDNFSSLAGRWIDKSGIQWHFTQEGNILLLNDDSKRLTGHGTIVSQNVNGNAWIIHITLTAMGMTIHNRVQPFDNSMLAGDRDFFKLVESYKISLAPSPTNNIDPSISAKLVGSFFSVDKKTDKWQVIMKQNEGLYTLKHANNGTMKQMCVTLDQNSHFKVYISAESQNGKGIEALYCSTPDIKHLTLSNGEIWTLENSTMANVTPPMMNNVPNNSYFTQPNYIQPTSYNQMHSTYPPQGFFNQPPQQYSYGGYPNNSFHQPPPMNNQYQMPNNNFNPYFNTHQSMNTIPNSVPQTQTPTKIGWVESILECKNQPVSKRLDIVSNYSYNQYEKLSTGNIKEILEVFSNGIDKAAAIEKLVKNNAIGYIACQQVADDVVTSFGTYLTQAAKSIVLLAPFIIDRRQNAEAICKCLPRMWTRI